MGAFAFILAVFVIVRLLFAIFRSVAQSVETVEKQRRKTAALRDLEHKAANVEKQLAKVEKELKQPIQYNITIDGSKQHSITIDGSKQPEQPEQHYIDVYGQKVPIKNALKLSYKEFIEQEKRIAMAEKAARENQRFEWEQKRKKM